MPHPPLMSWLRCRVEWECPWQVRIGGDLEREVHESEHQNVLLAKEAANKLEIERLGGFYRMRLAGQKRVHERREASEATPVFRGLPGRL